MISVNEKSLCCGCNACGDACPVEAISYINDKEGFWYPVIDVQKCLRCEACTKVCPIINSETPNEHEMKKPDCYVAIHKNIDVVFSSTTGGMFTALAEAMYKKKGYVGGAIHNGDFSVSQYVSNKREDLAILRRSKDLQSNAQGFYKRIKELLDGGENVLVCALPCQIAALKRFVDKDYSNLITVDLVCLGVNSPKVWRKYLDYIEAKYNSKVISTENKSKEYGWRNLTQKFVFADGQEAFDTVYTSLFIKGYVNTHLYCRPSCYNCRFKGFPRSADITIGDFWGIEKHDKTFDNDLGTSLVLINSEKGRKFFDEVKKRIRYRNVPLEWAVPDNPALVKSLNVISYKRDRFFEDLDKKSFDELIYEYSKEEKRKTREIKERVSGLLDHLRFLKLIFRITKLSPKAFFSTLKYSGVKNLWKHKGLIFSANSVINISKKALIEIKGLAIVGYRDRFPKSKRESKLFVGDGGKLRVLGDTMIGSGCDIEVFENAELVIHGKKHGVSDSNIGCTIICGEKIEIMEDVAMGRNVLIRDTNGDHYMNTLGYKTTRPVIIGAKTWLCESCTIMPGVKTGRGSIIGACSVVTSSVPDHSMVTGNPATICNDNVLFKI